MPAPVATGRRGALVALLVYGALAVAATWPLLPDSRGALTLGTEETSTVPAASAWALWWNADRVAHGWAGYWQAPIFAPTTDAFALSEPMPLPGALTAPATWLDGPALAANLWIFVALVLNGLAGRALARRLGVRPALATAAGAATVLVPFVHHELGVLTLVGVFGVLATLDAILALDQAPSWRTGLYLGAALAVTYLCCGQYAVFAALAAGPPSLALWGLGRRDRARWRATALAIAVAAAVIAPVALGQQRAAAHHPMRRTASRIADGAASTWAWARSSGVELVPQPGPAARPPGQRALFPGALKLALALAAVGAAALATWRGRGDLPHSPGAAARAATRGVWFVIATGALAFAWSTAPRAGGGWPLASLMSALPGLSQIRSVWRIGVIAQLAVVMLAFVALERFRARRATARGGAVTWAVAVAATVELWPRPPALAASPDAAAWRPVVAWVAARVPADAAIAHLPMPATGAVEDFAATGSWMLVGTAHGKRMINGYSSSFPVAHDRLWRLSRGFPDAASTEALRAAGVVALVLDDAWLAVDDRRARVSAAGWRVALAAPAAGVTIVVR